MWRPLMCLFGVTLAFDLPVSHEGESLGDGFDCGGRPRVHLTVPLK